MGTSSKLLLLIVLVALAIPIFANDASARTRRVNCDKGRSLDRVVNRSDPGDVILVRGTCRETVTIMTDKITIEGNEIAIVDGQDANQAVITIEGAKGVTLKNLIVRNGLSGIVSRRQAAVMFVGVIAEGNADDGIAITENSTARFSSCTARNNGDEGIVLFGNSSATFSPGGTVLPGRILSTGNAGRGIQVSGASSLLISGVSADATANVSDGIGVFGASRLLIVNGSTILSESNDFGLSVTATSSLFVSDDSTLTINGNVKNGLTISGNADAALNGTATITDNGSEGLLVFASSNLTLDGFTLIEGNGFNDALGIGALHINRLSNARLVGTLEIRGNTDFGLSIVEHSHTFLETGTLVIENNDRHGIFLARNSHVQLRGLLTGIDVKIRGNGGDGIFLDHDSGARLSSGTAISNNSGDGISCRQNSSVIANGILINGNDDDGINVDDCSADIRDSTIRRGVIGPPTNPAVIASFGSRLTLFGNSISGGITCDSSVLSRGDTVCP